MACFGKEQIFCNRFVTSMIVYYYRSISDTTKSVENNRTVKAIFTCQKEEYSNEKKNCFFKTIFFEFRNV